jgi:hypothetical protein
MSNGKGEMPGFSTTVINDAAFGRDDIVVGDVQENNQRQMQGQKQIPAG